MRFLLTSLLLTLAAWQLPQATQLPPLPDAHGFGGPIVGVHDDALIVGGGANFPTPLLEGGAKVWHQQMWVLTDPEFDWQPVEPLPMALAYAACASTSEGVAVVGGSDAKQIFADAFLIQWDAGAQQLNYKPLPALPQASAFGSAECIDNKLYVLAGKSSKDDADLSGNFWQLDLSNLENGWQDLPSYPGEARFKMATAVQHNADGELCLYMISGSNHELRAKSDAFLYQPSTQEWHALPPPPYAANAATAISWQDDQVLTFSGTVDSDLFVDGKMRALEDRPNFSTRIQSFDVGSQSWQQAGSLQEGVVTTTAVQWGGSVVISSGETRPGIRTPMVQALPLPAQASSGFGLADQLVLLAYLGLMLGVGVYFAKRSKNTEDFFLAGRKIPWWAAGLSIFGTQLSAITFMAIPATAFGSDWRRFAGSLMAMPVFVIVIYYFLPRFRRLNITTAYEYLEQRFSRTIRLFASALFILFQIGRMGIVLLLPAIALAAVTPIPTHFCIALMGVLATGYTALGGISAVIWTDVLQVIVLIGGALACLLLAVSGAGGFDAAWSAAAAAEKLHIFDWRWSTSEMVGWVVIVGFFFTNLVPYTTDQTVIQRYLTTPNEKQAARSLWLNLAITIPTGILFYGLGTALWAYYQANPIALANLPAKEDQLVPWFVVHNLPTGVAGLVIAGIFAAAMSSLDSSINSVATAILNDFVRAGDDLRLARRLTIVLGVLGTATALLLASFEIKYLFDFFQKVLGLFGGALSGVFLLAVFCRRCHASAALAGLLAGSTLTIIAAFFTSIHFLLYAAVGSLGCIAVGWLSSWLLPRPTSSITPNGSKNISNSNSHDHG